MGNQSYLRSNNFIKKNRDAIEINHIYYALTDIKGQGCHTNQSYLCSLIIKKHGCHRKQSYFFGQELSKKREAI